MMDSDCYILSYTCMYRPADSHTVFSFFSAFFLSLVPAKPRRVPLPHTMPIVYSDAALCGDSLCAQRRQSHCCILTDNAGVYYTLSSSDASPLPRQHDLASFGALFECALNSAYNSKFHGCQVAPTRPTLSLGRFRTPSPRPYLLHNRGCLRCLSVYRLLLYHRCGFASFPSA